MKQFPPKICIFIHLPTVGSLMGQRGLATNWTGDLLTNDTNDTGVTEKTLPCHQSAAAAIEPVQFMGPFLTTYVLREAAIKSLGSNCGVPRKVLKNALPPLKQCKKMSYPPFIGKINV